MVKRLGQILSVFNEEKRIEYISILWELASEPDTNWRFRLSLSKQLNEILYLYPLKVVKEEIIPLIFQLCQDRMADVRYSAVHPIAEAIKILSEHNDIECVTNKIQTMFESRTCSKRLLYIRIADSCFTKIDHKLFDHIFLTNILQYAQDKIFNVRFSLSRFIKKHLYKHPKYEHHQLLLNNIEILKNDEEDI